MPLRHDTLRNLPLSFKQQKNRLSTIVRSNGRVTAGIRDYALALIGEHYADFGPTLAAEMLVQHHGLTVSCETLREWMTESGIWLSRKERWSFHQPCLRREAFGELIHIEGSEHRWFEDRGARCSHLVLQDHCQRHRSRSMETLYW
jgi:hypothetical protein